MIRFVLVAVCSLFALGAASVSVWGAGVKGVLYHRDQLAELEAQDLQKSGFDTLVLNVAEAWSPTEAERTQLNQIEAAGLQLALWIEVARDQTLADRHPEWMASIQGHPEWRRSHPTFPKVTKEQIVKVYPWVPIAYREAYEAQLSKTERILTQWPEAKLVFLNDIQGAPSACGCGHPLCRWTTDYGPKKTATRLGNDFAARFVASVKKMRSGLDVVPVWATECEEGDKPGLCAGVGCYNGACWREWSAQLEPLAAVSPMIGALFLEQTFQRSEIGPDWLTAIPASFSKMQKRYDRPEIGANRLIAVVEGWQSGADVQWRRKREQLESAGISSFIVARTKIEQGWEPRVFELP